MFKKFILIFTLTVFSVSCRIGNEEEILKKFSEEYVAVKNKYEENLSLAGTEEQYKTCRVQKATACEELLQKYGEQVSSDAAELLKSKLAIEISRFAEAEQKINGLIENNSPLLNDAKLAKIQILIYQNKPEEALPILREIQDKVEPGLELLSAYLYFALYSRDSKIINEYAGKFLAAPAIPRSLSTYSADINRSLSLAALLENDREGALSKLEKAISETNDREKKLAWQSELARIQAIGNPAPPIYAVTWLNSYPLDLLQLRNKVVLIVFWAPWSSHCRQLMPALVNLYGKFKEKGLVIIGVTKLYGNYKDDLEDKGIVNPNDEITFINEFITRHQVVFPVAIAVEAANAERYQSTDIPTLIFIDKKGKLALNLVGTWQETFLANKINQLLEE